MNKNILRSLIKDLIVSSQINTSGVSRVTEDIKVPGYDGLFTITVEYKPKIALESYVELASLNRAETISALPSGATCGCCNGTGRA
jgi:hypothetical protein